MVVFMAKLSSNHKSIKHNNGESAIQNALSRRHAGMGDSVGKAGNSRWRGVKVTRGFHTGGDCVELPTFTTEFRPP